MKIALVQMSVKASPEENLLKIKDEIKKAKNKGADLVLFPEMCACPYENSAFVRYAMKKDDTFLLEIGEAAKEHEIFVVAGSVPEADKKKIYNTSFVFDTQGRVIAKHRKMHLFDINIEGGQYFMESDTFTAGKWVTTFDTPWGKMGLAICYDIRFPEVFRMLGMQGVKGVFVPAAFNTTTGPAHWELSFRARALDNQIFMAGASPAQDKSASYVAWGHSISTDPWGEVIAQMDEKEGMLLVQWDMEKLDKVRRELPLWSHLRTDCYCVCEAEIPFGNHFLPPLDFLAKQKDARWRLKNKETGL